MVNSQWYFNNSYYIYSTRLTVISTTLLLTKPRLPGKLWMLYRGACSQSCFLKYINYFGHHEMTVLREVILG
jgi:hypothetical protein